jgi:hypothetical protein
VNTIFCSPCTAEDPARFKLLRRYPTLCPTKNHLHINQENEIEIILLLVQFPSTKKASGVLLLDAVAGYISKNFTLRLVRRVRLTHRAHQAQIAVLDASLRTHFVRTRTLPVRAPQTPPGANPPASSIFSQP